MGKITKVGGDAGQIYMDQTTGKVSGRGRESLPRRRVTSFVPVERILMALVMVKSKAKDALDRWRHAQSLNAAVNDIRKGRTADSASAEDSYDALKKYALI